VKKTGKTGFLSFDEDGGMTIWKHTERELAKRLNGERVPVSGRTGEKGREAPDINHDRFAIEVKQRKKPRPGGSSTIPKWMAEAMKQAEASRQPHHRHPSPNGMASR